MALTEVALVELTEMLDLTGVVHGARDLRQWASYPSGWDPAYIKLGSPVGLRVLRRSNSVARIPAMRLRTLPCQNLSAGHRLFLAAQNRKELPRAWEVVGHFRLCHWDVDRDP